MQIFFLRKREFDQPPEAILLNLPHQETAVEVGAVSDLLQSLMQEEQDGRSAKEIGDRGDAIGANRDRDSEKKHRLHECVIAEPRLPVGENRDGDRQENWGIAQSFRAAFGEGARGGDEVDRTAYEERGLVEAEP